MKAAESDSRIPQAIERLRAEIAELEQALDDDTLQGRLDTALSLVNRDLTGTRARQQSAQIRYEESHCRR